jgi:hypothetical protein
LSQAISVILTFIAHSFIASNTASNFFLIHPSTVILKISFSSVSVNSNIFLTAFFVKKDTIFLSLSFTHQLQVRKIIFEILSLISQAILVTISSAFTLRNLPKFSSENQTKGRIFILFSSTFLLKDFTTPTSQRASTLLQMISSFSKRFIFFSPKASHNLF